MATRRTSRTGTAEADLPAGDFAAWLHHARVALEHQGDMDVPCDGCTACCTSSHFIHIGPGERQTLASIPSRLLFPAPGLPAGYRVVGYDKAGRCPMLAGAGCAIYGQRPLTCRTYDCRVFAAAGVTPDDPAIAARARRWLFSYETPAAREEHASVQRAAAVLGQRGAACLGGAAPFAPTHAAILALEIYDLFVAGRSRPGDGAGPGDEALAAAVAAAERRLAARRGRPS